jgi:hypothetical protein
LIYVFRAKPVALWATGLFSARTIMSVCLDSNQGPQRYKLCALTN